MSLMGQFTGSDGPISAQPLLAMHGSDAMALSIVVGILDLVNTYMKPMETASINLHHL